MAWKRIGAAWTSNKGGISITLSEGEALEFGTKGYLFPKKEKKSDKSPDWDLCIKVEDNEEERF